MRFLSIVFTVILIHFHVNFGVDVDQIPIEFKRM